MKVIKTWNFPGKLNMALDMVLTEHCNEPILRFYTWARPTLSLGRHQKRVNLDTQFLRENNMDLVVRPTGGRAVLHWDELTYALILPIEDPKAKGGVLQTYLVISECIATALRKLGFDARIEPVKRLKAGTAACFDAPSSYEITIDGKKIVGSAQMRTQKSVLQHGSIVLKQHAREYAKILMMSENDLEGRLSGLCEYQAITLQELVEKLQNEFENVFGKSEPFTPTQEIMELAFQREEEFACREN